MTVRGGLYPHTALILLACMILATRCVIDTAASRMGFGSGSAAADLQWHGLTKVCESIRKVRRERTLKHGMLLRPFAHVDGR
jgi:hypothetical protein